MKIYTIMAILFSLVLLPFLSNAEEFLGVPVIPKGEIIRQTKKRMVIRTGLSHDKVYAFYKDALKESPDIKFREWKDQTYIEDDGNMKWHSITISKGNDEVMTTVVIKKDNWTWIIGTLVLRYVGVFVVLLVLFLGMSLSGNIISRTIKRMEVKGSGEVKT
jgi:hypothetical protein